MIPLLVGAALCGAAPILSGSSTAVPSSEGANTQIPRLGTAVLGPQRPDTPQIAAVHGSAAVLTEGAAAQGKER